MGGATPGQVLLECIRKLTGQAKRNKAITLKGGGVGTAAGSELEG